jgi:23S rRNA pseudouridine1911/1915/1917 synthase
MNNINTENAEPITRELKISLEFAGQRFDKVAALMFSEFSRAELTRWIVDGSLTLDRKSSKPKTTVWGGEILCLNAVREIREAWHKAERMEFEIIHEDAHILIINKPAGLVVHPGAGNPSGTLVNGLLHHRPDLAELPRAGVVHRLDKDTSGIMVVAASQVAQRHLVDAIQERQVERRYLAICEGVMVTGQNVDKPIGRDPKVRTKQVVRDDGKPALSEIRVRERYRNHTLVNVKLGSGRTHQIRVHMQSIGFPLVGDHRYGCRRIIPKGADSETIDILRSFPRQALHAAKLAFVHPHSGAGLEFAAPLPTDFDRLQSALADDAR